MSMSQTNDLIYLANKKCDYVTEMIYFHVCHSIKFKQDDCCDYTKWLATSSWIDTDDNDSIYTRHCKVTRTQPD